MFYIYEWYQDYNIFDEVRSAYENNYSNNV